MTSRWPQPLFYIVLVAAMAADQLTKLWATRSLLPVESVSVIPNFFSLTYSRNTGIAFGMFAGKGLLVAGFIVVLAVVAFSSVRGMNWARREPNVIGGMLCGGALGNLLDRVRQGYVVDFFDVYIGPKYWQHWPTFNVADSLICVCVGWIVVRQLQGSERRT